MRLDKFFSMSKVLSRKECKQAVKKGLICVNDIVAKTSEMNIDENKDIVKYNNEVIFYNEFVYIMLNKPAGYVSSTDDPRDKTVLELLPTSLTKFNLFPCGRLDKDTVGLVILTNDGVSTHCMLAPKNAISKKYYFELADCVNNEDVLKIENGILLADGYVTKPCKIELVEKNKGYIYLTEGKYHEIKRMFGAVNNRVTYLKRVMFGGIFLDKNLKEGEYRMLTDEEIKLFTKFKK